MLEQFCDQSDQQTARLFRGEGRRAAMALVLPEVDHEWFTAVESAEIFNLIDGGDLKLASEHHLQFRCGCDSERITKIVSEREGRR